VPSSHQPAERADAARHNNASDNSRESEVATHVKGGCYILADVTSERTNVNNQFHSGHAASERSDVTSVHLRM